MPVRARFALLSVLGLATLALLAVAIVFHARAGFFPPIPLATAFIVIFVLSWLQLRHFGFALLVAFGPLPALPWLGGIALIWPAAVAFDPLAMAFGYAAGALLADVCARNIAAPDRPDAALRLLWLPMAAALGALAALLAAAAFFLPVTSWRAAWILVEAILFASSAAAAVLLPVPLFAGSEDFVARWNRWREFQARTFSDLAFAAQPRWGWSIGGISLVMGAVTFFAVPRSVPAIAWIVLAAILFAAALAALRGWRGALAVAVALLLSMLIALWAGSLPDAIQAGMAIVLPLAVMMAMAGRLAPLQEREEPAAVLAAAYGDHASGVVFASLAAAVSLAGFAVVAVQAFIAAIVLALAGAVAALIVQPAFTAIFVDLLPRRRSVEELYRAP